MDQIIARKIACYGRHGVLESEKTQAQRFEIDLIIYKDLSTAAARDDLRYTVDYSEVSDQVREIVEKEIIQFNRNPGLPYCGHDIEPISGAQG